MAKDKNGAPLKVGDVVNVRCVVSDIYGKQSPPGVLVQVVQVGNDYGAHLACDATSVELVDEGKPTPS